MRMTHCTFVHICVCMHVGNGSGVRKRQRPPRLLSCTSLPLLPTSVLPEQGSALVCGCVNLREELPLISGQLELIFAIMITSLVGCHGGTACYMATCTTGILHQSASHVWVPDALLLIQFAGNAPGKASQGLGPCHQVGNPDGVPGSGLAQTCL